MSLSHTQTQNKVGQNKRVNRTILNLDILLNNTSDHREQDHRLIMEQRHNLRTLLIHSTLRISYLKMSKI